MHCITDYQSIYIALGYGDVKVPDNIHWFMIFYLSLSTYFVGIALGKLGALSKKLEAIRRHFAWEQQESSHDMLADFSGRDLLCCGSQNGDNVETEREM